MRGLRGLALVGLVSGMLAGCAKNGELGFSGHPLDCAMGVGHSDCAPGTPGFARYARDGSTVAHDTFATMAALRATLTSFSQSGEPEPLSQSARMPLISGNAFEGQIDGTYEGWTGDTIYRLTNGQVWRQSGVLYRYHYAFSPRVLVYRTVGGSRMHVFGDNGQDATVEQLK